VLTRLRAAPITVPTLVGVAIFLAWVPLDGGQPLTRWVPGALAVLALLGIAAAAVPGGVRDAPAAVRAAVALLAAFTAWSFLSIAWAGDQGAALEGADRTLLYLAVFALFALWPQRSTTAGWVVGAWTLGMGVLALVTVLRVGLVDDPTALFVGDRLASPAGYPNAAAATWFMALWPAITLAASARVPWALRGAFAAAAVLLAGLALLSLSRGAVLSLPFCLAIFVAAVPGRLRHVAVLAPIALAVVAATPAIFDVGPAITAGHATGIQHAAGAAVRAIVLLAVGAGLVVGAAAALEAARPPSPATTERVRRAWTRIVVAAAVVAAIGGLAVVGNPVTRAHDAWRSFKGGYGATAGNRLTSGLGSNRYDFYRVAVDVFADHPVIGAGADNFFQDYLRLGRSDETPRYPHDLALRTLSQTGIAGGLLLLGAFASALAAAWRGMRRPDPLAAAVAGGAAMAFVYWVVHGMTDWFWEWAGLGAPAFALLGIACSLAPRRAAAVAATAERRRPAWLAPVLGAAGLLVAALALAGPWLAEREVRQAGRVFAARPFEAYDRLDRAAGLNPAADRPALVKGSIALRYGDLPRAVSAFEAALARNARGQYATLELGAIASAQGDRSGARRLLERAVALAPRDPTAREALGIVRSGGAVDVAGLNRRILVAGQRIGVS
jgi:tetratricopeptide (TPR) repeat protein